MRFLAPSFLFALICQVSTASAQSNYCADLAQYIKSQSETSSWEATLNDYAYSKTQILLIGEVHNDSSSRTQYLKLLSKEILKEAGFDCLFLELAQSLEPAVRRFELNESEFQSIVEDDLNALSALNFNAEQLKSFGEYLLEYRPLFELAKQQNIDILPIDEEDAVVLPQSRTDRRGDFILKYRNELIASRIIQRFQNHACTRAIMIGGMAHFGLQSLDHSILSISQILNGSKINARSIFMTSQDSGASPVGAYSLSCEPVWVINAHLMRIKNEVGAESPTFYGNDFNIGSNLFPEQKWAKLRYSSFNELLLVK